MSHPTLPLDGIPAVCYLFPLPPLFSVYLHTTGAAVFWSVPNDNDCCKIRVIFRTLCTGEAFHCTQNWFPFNSDTVFNNIQYRTGNILLVSTGLLDDFLMTINIDTKLSSYPASRATEAAAKPACSLFLQIRICTRVALLSPSFSVSVLLNFICKTDVFRPTRPGTKKADRYYISFKPLIENTFVRWSRKLLNLFCKAKHKLGGCYGNSTSAYHDAVITNTA